MTIVLLVLKAFEKINKGLKVKVRSGKERTHSAEGTHDFQMTQIILYMACMVNKHSAGLNGCAPCFHIISEVALALGWLI